MFGTLKERLTDLNAIYPIWEERTLWEGFRFLSKKYSNQPFLICQDESLSYADTLSRASAYSKALYAIGVRKHDRIAMILHNCLEFVPLSFAIARLGAICVPVNPKLSSEESDAILKNTQAKCCIRRESAPDNRLYIEISAESNTGESARRISWNEFLEKSKSVTHEEIQNAEKMGRNPNAPCLMLYTSGSTSVPKGVLISSDMLLRSSYGTARTRLMEPGRRIMTPLPFYHIMGYLEGVLAVMHVGGSVVFANRGFDPENIIWLMKHYQVNDLICVPVIIIEILEKCRISQTDFPSLHAAYWGGNCPQKIWDDAAKILNVSDLTTGYGMTECGSTTSIVSPLDPPGTAKNHHGRLKDGGSASMPGTNHLLEVMICYPGTLDRVENNTEGEIVSRGLTITSGYFNNLSATEQAFSKGGWFHSGDLGCMRPDGMLTYLGRIDDLYKINGENVSPQYIDHLIGKCPLVRAVEVVGIPSSKYGEVGAAFIEPVSDSTETKRKIEEYCQSHLASFQIPAHYFYGKSDSWPRSTSGKVQKFRLRALAGQKLSDPY